MEESQPFLEESSVEENKDVSIRWRSHRGLKPMGSESVKIKLIASHFAVFVITSCIWGAFFAPALHVSRKVPETKVYIKEPHLYNADLFTSKSGFITCGQSLEEAKTLGCQYDILTNNWLPGQCTDELSIEEYQADGSWFPYADENRTEILSVDQLGDLRFYYTSMRDHIAHCAVLWRRQFRALTEDWKYIDSGTVDREHTMHCANFLMEKAELPGYREMPIKVFVGQSGCHVRNS